MRVGGPCFSPPHPQPLPIEGRGAYVQNMADDTNIGGAAMPTLEDWQHWALVMGRAQQMLMEFWAENLNKDQPFPAWSPSAFGFAGGDGAGADPMVLMSAGAEAGAKGFEAWGKAIAGAVPASGGDAKEA